MRYPSLTEFLSRGRAHLAAGPVGLILAEDAVEVTSTVRHHRDLGFRSLIVFASTELTLPESLGLDTVRVDHDMTAEDAMTTVVNRVIGAAPPGTWLYACYNAEYLFFPFCEHRTVGEMLAFHTEERRDAMLSYVVDLYAGDLAAHPSAVSLEDAQLDKTGYYALARPDPANHGHPKERQLDFFGGLRWRFEEHVPAPRRRIDRVALFRARPGLTIRDDHTFDDEEYNPFACPWHNNLTAAICSFRTAKALKRNPGSSFAIGTFRWHNSTPFEWHSQQLLDLGLMEPGQWF
ncbi:glycosyltransferase family 2 protein [Wenxinia marina]|uniref:Wenxma_21, whole genome shotgun sequence n=1 Tax=Wenxinia marina DSM 24838 TaxID=1123501 RepID=A0A0D0NGU6_9RHOB|nr:glycosyltransferase family 2 protein [Wenxinia marina]KIQ67555.1 hypothetical protein Wenmar_03980 [Wenxinia marina DSM 24838]